MENSLYRKRFESVRKILELNHLDGALFSSLENIRYLCGFTGSDGAFVMTKGIFLTDFGTGYREEEVKRSQIIHYKGK
jgi:Xaa-Pro aminopeptidase